MEPAQGDKNRGFIRTTKVVFRYKAFRSPLFSSR
jgi:hypothetical protein